MVPRFRATTCSRRCSLASPSASSASAGMAATTASSVSRCMATSDLTIVRQARPAVIGPTSKVAVRVARGVGRDDRSL